MTILDMPEIRARDHRWTVADYRAPAGDNPAFHRSESVYGIIVEKEMKRPLHNGLTKRMYDLFLRRAPEDRRGGCRRGGGSVAVEALFA